MAGMGFMIAASSRKRDDRGRYMEGDQGNRMDGNYGNYSRMGNDHSTHMEAPEMRRRRDSSGRYMEDEGGNRMAYEGNQGRNEAAYRPWPEPHIPPYLDEPEMNDSPSRMRDRNIVNIRDYQDKRRIGFGENRMHHGEDMSSEHYQGHAEAEGRYPMMEKLSEEMATSWVEGMENADSEHPKGPKWSKETVKPLAMKHGFSAPEKQLEFWAVMNMMYSDYCETAKKHGVSTMDFYADMAKAWMKDKDAVENKTAAYVEFVTK